MQDIVKIVRNEIIDKIDNSVMIKQIIVDDVNFVILKLCNNKWLKQGRFLTDSNLENWQIVEFNDDSGEIKVLRPSGTAVLRRRQVLTIIQPTFVFGTMKTAENEWKLRTQENSMFGLPLIWLSAVVNEDEKEINNSVDYEANLRIFFLDNIDIIDSLDDQQRDQAVRPMLGLEKAFNEAIEESYSVSRLRTGLRRTLSIFGNEDKDGIYEMIFDEELGGVEARPTLTIYKSVACKC